MKICLLWHMHQPWYRLPGTRVLHMPWVRMHALKSYWGMARLARRHEGQVMTFNLVPSLLAQVEAYGQGVRDELQLLCARSPGDLEVSERSRLLRDVFSLNASLAIEPYPRYQALWLRYQAMDFREREAGCPGFSHQEIRDLQVWVDLVHMDEEARAEDPLVRELMLKGAGFSDEDQRALAERELWYLSQVIPEYRMAARDGRVELSTSPYYHPILPLLCDSDSAAEADPAQNGLQPHLQWAEDAERQLLDAIASHTGRFGVAPAGLWPSEGSVSEPVLDMAARLGFSWTATDEAILRRSLGAAGVSADEGWLFQPYRWRNGSLSLLFREHGLSDRVGFVYQKWAPGEAARDLVGRWLALSSKHPEGVLTLILDGENPWDYYPQSGRPFLEALLEEASRHRELELCACSSAVTGATRSLEHLVPGSWIDGTFRIWFGHEDDRRAWGLLDDIRKRLQPEQLDEQREIREGMLAAEGSDWFWWYGEENPTPELDRFDHLFRANLQRVCRLAGLTPPPGLEKPVHLHPGGKKALPGVVSVYPLTPSWESPSRLSWLGAARLELNAPGGAMATGRTPFQLCLAAWDERFLHLLFPAEGAADLNGISSLRLCLRLAEDTAPAGTFTLKASEGPPGLRLDREGLRVMLPREQVAVSEGQVLELSGEIFGGEGYLGAFVSHGAPLLVMGTHCPGPWLV